MTVPISVDGRLDEDVWTRAPVAAGSCSATPRRPAGHRADRAAPPLRRGRALRRASASTTASPDASSGSSPAATSSRKRTASRSSWTPSRPPDRGGVPAERGGGAARLHHLRRQLRGRLWDAVWESAVTVDGDGWTVEMRIPFSQLRFPAAASHTWGSTPGASSTARTRVVAGARAEERERPGLANGSPRGHRGDRPAQSPGAAALRVGARGVRRTRPRRRSLQRRLARVRRRRPRPQVRPGHATCRSWPRSTPTSARWRWTRPSSTSRPTRRSSRRSGRSSPKAAQVFSHFARSGSSEYRGFFYFEPQLFYSRRIGRTPQGRAAGDYVDRPAATTILGAAKVTGRTSGRLDGRACGSGHRPRVRRGINGLIDGQRSRSSRSRTTSSAARGASWGGGRRSASSAPPCTGGCDGPPRGLLVGQAWVGGVDGHVFLDSRRDWVVCGGMAGSTVSGSRAAVAAPAAGRSALLPAAGRAPRPPRSRRPRRSRAGTGGSA